MRRSSRAQRAAVARLPARDRGGAGVIKTMSMAVSAPEAGRVRAPTAYLAEILADSRARTLDLVSDLDYQQLIGSRLDIVNPLLWEIGHVAWFHERWILRHLDGHEPIRTDADVLYDSIAIAHDRRWDLPLPSLRDTLAYLEQVHDALLARLRGDLATPEDTYFYQLTTFHEDMHGEAFVYTRQTLGYPAPRIAGAGQPRPEWGSGPLRGDAEVPGGTYLLGALDSEPFVFDNEKWAHEVALRPFRIARAAVTNREFACFVEEDGYRRKYLWSVEGWRWRQTVGAESPVYWVRGDRGEWLERRFDGLFPLSPHAPAVNVSWFEAQAYCRWAGRRLPTEAEWELAASAEPLEEGVQFFRNKRKFPWGDEAPVPDRANLDGRLLGCVDVGSLPAGDSGAGCRQMMGNVWEWTATTFAPYPGFTPDPYREYSEPWFYTRKVLRGGSWASRSRLLRNTWRNFFTPDRRDVLAGFRTCAL
jgi:iron(II)-dependent oxidoreductase